MDLSIAIGIGSPLSDIVKVKRTIESIFSNIGTKNFKFIISIAPQVPLEIKNYVYQKKKQYPSNFEIMAEADLDWAVFINQAIDLSKNCKYFIVAHDDIELLTSDFFHKVIRILSRIKEPVGWVSFTDKDYINSHWAPSVRYGYHADYRKENAWGTGRLFQFHKLPKGWFSKEWKQEWEKLLDYPDTPVKCHAPFNHFVLIKMETLLKIGFCEDWQTKNALLVDEDWGLRALKLGYFNIWIPSIEYIHYRMEARPVKMFNSVKVGLFKIWLPSRTYFKKFFGLYHPGGGGSRSTDQILRYQKRVHELFRKKWGFSADPNEVELKKIKDEYKDTNIVWSIGRKSYEWERIE